jgi:hypothetical protein
MVQGAVNDSSTSMPAEGVPVPCRSALSLIMRGVGQGGAPRVYPTSLSGYVGLVFLAVGFGAARASR